MIIIAGTVDVHAEDLNAFLAAVKKVSESSRQEKGCLAYQFAHAVEDRNRLSLFEVWADKAAFDSHLQAPHFLAYREATGKLRQTRNIGRYDGSELKA